VNYEELLAQMNILAPIPSWRERILSAWRKGVEAILDTGYLLTEAKKALPHGEWQDLIAKELPFKARTAQMLMAIAADGRLTKPQHVALLPPAMSTLYELTRLNDEQFEKALKDGTINPDMERKAVSTATKTRARAEREAMLGAKITALPTKRYGLILADPEWRFEPWSRATGLDRAADNHYPTSCTEVIAARDVPSIAANHCVLAQWATVPMLPHSLLVMAAWGFDYRSHYAWVKTNSAEEGDLALGTGYWNRNAHELLLLGVRGHPPAPAPGTQYPSVIHAMIGPHSSKPEVFIRMLEEYYPTLPKIELNRRGAPRPGWDPWGFEATPGEQAA
jgi:N6-adenosine-specific RNA methylase IME4